MSDDGYGTPPLFDIPTGGGPMRRGEALKAPRVIAWGNCPQCRNPRVGLIRSGQHLTWRWHTLTTWSGTGRTCISSGQHVCDLPEATPYVTPVAGPVICPHQAIQGIIA